MVDDKVFETILKNKTESFYIKNACNPKEIFTWDNVEQYINDSIHNSEIVSIGDNSSKKSVYKSLVNHSTDTKSLYNEIMNGNSFILNSMEKYTKGLFYASNIFSTIQDKYVTTNIYGGLKSSSKSFKAHADAQYVLILQLDGISDWTIYNECWDGKLDTVIIEDESKISVDIHCTLKPGDVLYIPFIRYHKCIPLSRRLSASVSADYNSARPAHYGDWFSLN